MVLGRLARSMMTGPLLFEAVAERFAAQVGSVLLEEGFQVNSRETRVFGVG